MFCNAQFIFCLLYYIHIFFFNFEIFFVDIIFVPKIGVCFSFYPVSLIFEYEAKPHIRWPHIREYEAGESGANFTSVIYQCKRIMSVVFPWICSPHGSYGLAHHRYTYYLWELSDANTQTLSGPLTLIRSLWCLEGQMVVVAIRAPGLTPLPIAGWLALGYEAFPLPNASTIFQT